ncbi:glycosyltransferase [Filobacillus milosensis]|uniref:Glycosyltransferase n=1 Tax=Filobacillus milosensis TaxID=94137 RepID=A0A4Y8IQQ1_9BACI|nr:glycosyltransferase [Filobacillus milosensis]TFB23886.1 glycosyltransferase [Filobacillus milosensis]
MKKLLAIMLTLSFMLLMTPSTISIKAQTQEECLSQTEVTFKNDFRRLWIDHVLWTSNYITSATTAGSEDQKQVLARLLRNQEDIGNAIKPLYGEEAGNKLTELLKEHIVIAGKIVEAALNKKEDKIEQLNKEWYRNADDIVVFLSGANPNLKSEDLKELLYIHLELVTDDLVASLDKEWDDRIVAIDDGLTHIIIMADAISQGVIKQFPEKFNQ